MKKYDVRMLESTDSYVLEAKDHVHVADMLEDQKFINVRHPVTDAIVFVQVSEIASVIYMGEPQPQPQEDGTRRTTSNPGLSNQPRNVKPRGT